MSRRRQRVLLIGAAVVIGVLALQEPGSATVTAHVDAQESTTTVPETSEADQPEAVRIDTAALDPTSTTNDEGRRATWIAIGMVVAALAIGGLLVLSKP